MQKKFQFLILAIVCLFVLFPNTTFAQEKSKKNVDKYFDESGGFKHRLWYGGGFNLGFSGDNAYSQFNIGITPMVGYKVLPSLSFGPRFGFDYTYIKGETIDETGNPRGRRSANLLNYSVGAFGRFKFLKFLFLHAEANYKSDERAYIDQYSRYLVYDSKINKIYTERIGSENYLAGLGYNSGDGVIGYEIVGLYNFSVPSDSPALPFEFRFGFTYKF